jgi:transaldolase/glucose-6-phosphate isomerase
MGWLDVVAAQGERLTRFARIARDADGFSQVLLLGMGGSSLCPEVLARTFKRQPYAPELIVLDSTDPEELRAVEDRIVLERTLFVVASKSGTTLEVELLEAWFHARLSASVGAEEAARRFVAITDPGTPLEARARSRGYRAVHVGDPSIGGRYSALSDFGLVPAAMMGLKVGTLLDRAAQRVEACGPRVAPAQNPGVALGALLGVAAREGRDKLTIVAAPALAPLGAWIEQLFAESTGKDGRALIPVEGEPLAGPEAYGPDRQFLHLELEGEPDPERSAALDALQRAGHPVVRLTLRDRWDLAAEFFRLELAAAVAAAVLHRNPFDQPDVEASRSATRDLAEAWRATGALPPDRPFHRSEGLELHADQRNASELFEAVGGMEHETLVEYLAAHFARLGPGDYAAIGAFLARGSRHAALLDELREALRDASGAATCVGFGPRFLHSTGQAHKGGPNSGVFLVLTADPGRERIEVPGHGVELGVVQLAQARGELEVLGRRGRRVLRVHFGAGADTTASLERLVQVAKQALTRLPARGRGH